MQDTYKTPFNYEEPDIKVATNRFISGSSKRTPKPTTVFNETQDTSWITEDSWQSENSTPSPTRILPLPDNEDLPEPLPLPSMEMNLDSEANSEDTIMQEVSVMFMKNVQPMAQFSEISFKDKFIIAQRIEGTENKFVPRVKDQRNETQAQKRKKEDLNADRFLCFKQTKELRKYSDEDTRLNSVTSHSKDNYISDIDALLEMAEARLKTDAESGYISPDTSKSTYNSLRSIEYSEPISHSNTTYSSYDNSFRSTKHSKPFIPSKPSKPSKLSKPPRQGPKVVAIDLSTRKFISRNSTPNRSASNSRRISTPSPRYASSSHSKEPSYHTSSNPSLPSPRYLNAKLINNKETSRSHSKELSGHTSSNPNLVIRRNLKPKAINDQASSNAWTESLKVREKLREYYS